jgi:hypothetical protein
MCVHRCVSDRGELNKTTEKPSLTTSKFSSTRDTNGGKGLDFTDNVQHKPDVTDDINTMHKESSACFDVAKG